MNSENKNSKNEIPKKLFFQNLRNAIKNGSITIKEKV